MSVRLSLDLPEDAFYIPLTRQFARALLELLQVVPEDIEDVETIISELVTNVIRHAQSDDGRFQVVLEFAAADVVIVVIDAGHGFLFRDVPEIGTLRPDIGGGERFGGFGLPLLDALSDRLQFRRTDPHGTTVRAEKNLRYLTQTDADNAEEMNGSSEQT